MRLLPFRRSPAFPLGTPLLQLSPVDQWRLRHAVEGTVILGGTGAGKSSGSGRAIAHAFLKAGMGGLVLAAKPGERKLWERYCAECGRSRSLIVFDHRGKRRFNFLNYELRRGERLVTHNLVSLFMRIVDAAHGGQGGDTDNPFWRQACSELLSNAFAALYCAYGHVSLTELMELIDSAPQNEAQVAEESWRDTSFCYRTLYALQHKPTQAMPEVDARTIGSYFLKRWPRLADKTRTNIVATLTALIHPFLTGYLRELFCTTTSVVPEMTHEGAILLIDLPVKEHSESGIIAQHIFKYLWQRATERRPDSDRTRPAFLWADECQFFISAYDAEFQSTARSSRACTVYLTQNLPTFYDRIGGKHPEHTADSLLGNFQTKIFHAQSDPKTNQWAADLVGKAVQWKQNVSSGENRGSQQGRNSGWSWSASNNQSSRGGSSGYSSSISEGTSHTTGASETTEYPLLPSYFTKLRKGGPENAFLVEGVVYQAGRLWGRTRTTWMPCVFRQR